MQRHLILYARTPRYGRVKTRLARDIGNIDTLRFYRRTLTTIARRLSALAGCRLYLALTPDKDVDNAPVEAFQHFSLIKQGGGDLGARMARSFQALPKGPAVLIGSDIPDIQPRHIKAAFDALGTHDAVFGPCHDGGYWLIGLKRRCAAPRDFLTRVRWSSPESLNDTLSTLPKHWKVAYIEYLDDIDTGTAYHAWRMKDK